MSYCESELNEEPCINLAVPMGGKYSLCAAHHEQQMLNNPEYRESVSAWYVSPDVLIAAREAEADASTENIERALEMVEMQQVIQRGDDVVSEHKEQVFRRRFAALDKWNYRVKVRKELERAAAERAAIDADMTDRLGRNYDEIFRNINSKTLDGLIEPSRTINEYASLETRIRTEFGM